MARSPFVLAGLCLIATAAPVLAADDADDRAPPTYTRSESGFCRVERTWQPDGTYRESRECEGDASERREAGTEIYWDRRCQVTRQWRSNGSYAEERTCERE